MRKSPRYTCAAALRRLDRFVDRDLSEPELRAIQEHLDLCVDCAAEAEFEASLVRAIAGRLRRLRLPPTLRQEVMSALRLVGMN